MELSSVLKVDLKKPNDKYLAYCRTDEMKKTIKLTNTTRINEMLNKVIKDTNLIKDAI